MAAPLGFVRRLCALQRRVRPTAARAVAYFLLRRLAAHQAPGLKMRRYRCQVPAHARKLLEGIAGFLIARPLDEAAYYLSCVYAVLCDPDERRELAMYFTPPALARHLVESVALETPSFTRLSFLDPACGGAAFLLPAVVTLRDLLRKEGASAHDIIRAVNRQVSGIEKNPVLAELAQQFIRIALAQEITKCRAKLGPIVKVGNALHLYARQRIPRVNVLLCNPPYRKIHADELAWYRRRFPGVIAGQPNLYTMFMHAAKELVAPGGVIALLTPTSYFSGPTYEPIRAEYARDCAILRVDLIHERDNLFLGVEHDVAALFARPRLTRPAEQSPEVFGWNETDGWTSLGSVALPRDGSPWRLPRDKSTAQALAKSKITTSSLAEYGYKPRIGVYVWNRDTRRTRKRRPRHNKDRKNAVPVIWASQIGQDGVFRFVSRSAKEKRARYILLRPGDRRGVVERDCVVLQRTSSRAQRRRLVAATLPRGFAKKHGGFVGENHTIILEPTSGRPPVPRKTLARLLNSEFIRDLYSTTTGTTAVTAAGLSALPLPDPHTLKSLLARRRGLEAAIRAAFGLRPAFDETSNPDAKATAA
jgi:adenine-specific DNA-methyltransferase